MKNLILALALLLPVFGQAKSSAPVLSTYQVLNLDDAVMKQVADKFEVIRKLPNGYEVIVPAARSPELLQLAPNSELIVKDNSLALRKSQAQFGGVQYRTYDQIVASLKKLAESKPDLVQFVEYGKSKDGHALFAIKISDNVTKEEAEPELLITAATHGDEVITTEIMLNLIDRIMSGYANHEARYENMVNGHELYFIPVVNADGFINQDRYDDGQDPNRSYPWPEDPQAKSTPSITALIKFFQAHNFVGSIDYHAYGELTMYPWAYTSKSLPQKEHAEFDALAQKMAATNNYKYGPINEVIYVAKGSSADYYYWTKGTKAFAIEVGSDKSPNPSQISRYTQDQAESMYLFIENF